MTGPLIGDLDNVEVEHMVGLNTGLPLVKLRATGTADRAIVLVAQMSPAEARQVAEHLHECAARAEYEIDLIQGLTAAGLGTDTVLAVTLGAARSGEQIRHTSTGGIR